jgi:hypothetical protein
MAEFLVLRKRAFGALLIILVIKSDRGPGPTERERDGLAQTGAAARHQGNVVRKRE